MKKRASGARRRAAERNTHREQRMKRASFIIGEDDEEEDEEEEEEEEEDVNKVLDKNEESHGRNKREAAGATEHRDAERGSRDASVDAGKPRAAPTVPRGEATSTSEDAPHEGGDQKPSTSLPQQPLPEMNVVVMRNANALRRVGAQEAVSALDRSLHAARAGSALATQGHYRTYRNAYFML